MPLGSRSLPFGSRRLRFGSRSVPFGSRSLRVVVAASVLTTTLLLLDQPATAGPLATVPSTTSPTITGAPSASPPAGGPGPTGAAAVVVAPADHPPVGALDALTKNRDHSVTVSGWAYDPDAPAAQLRLDLVVDNVVIAHQLTDLVNPRAMTSQRRSVRHAVFRARTEPLAWGVHQVCVTARGVPTAAAASLGCRSITLFNGDNPSGTISFAIDSARHTVTASGSVFDPNATSTALTLLARRNGSALDSFTTTLPSAALNKQYGISGNHGFSHTWTFPIGTTTVCVSARNIGAGTTDPQLGCRTVTFVRQQTLNEQIAAYAMTFVGKYPYVNGGRSPQTGFDCSGLTQYIYGHFGVALPDTAEPQYRQFRQISQAQAQPGDLIFFHQGPGGWTWHVGIYEGGDKMVAAATAEQGIRYQTWTWWPDVTFGTLR
ncbi:MAG: hypothetical protein QOK10_1295 [Pseudonocardiales bacterium]|jgi:cell wall-associated NlpC family hydrolase|nr:hypothetical protein [Pseudonocardiales bacterium]